MMKRILIWLFLFTQVCNIYSQDIYGTAKNKDTTYLDPNDFNVGQYITIDTVNGNKIFVGKADSSVKGADYKFLRAVLKQDTALSSGKITVQPIDYSNNYVTFADTYSNTASARLSTGVYLMQFKTGGINKFISSIDNLYAHLQFMREVIPIFGHYVPALDPEDPDVWTDELVGYLVLPCNNISGDFYLNTGGIIAKTYDTNWVLRDNILEDGYTVEIKVFSP